MSDNNNQDPTLRNNSIKPWIALLFRPRLAMREILEKETAQSAWNLWVAYSIVLAVVTPIIAYLQTGLWGVPIIYLKNWLLEIPVLAIINLLMFYFASYFFWKTSLWLEATVKNPKLK